MIDLKEFSDKETKGLTSLVRITDSSLAVCSKKFDSETGAELSEEVIGGNIQEYLDRKAELEAQLVDIDAFIKKFEVLTPQN